MNQDYRYLNQQYLFNKGKTDRDPMWKITKAKRVEGVSQGEEHLPSKCEILSSNPSTTKNNILFDKNTFQKWRK
jgi:hypothetical protein